MHTYDICVLEILGCPQECRGVVGSPIKLECPDHVRLVNGKRVDVREVVGVGGDRRLHDPVPHCFSAGSLTRFGSVGDEHGMSGHGEGLPGGLNESHIASYLGEPGPQGRRDPLDICSTDDYVKPLLNGTSALGPVLKIVRPAVLSFGTDRRGKL